MHAYGIRRAANHPILVRGPTRSHHFRRTRIQQITTQIQFYLLCPAARPVLPTARPALTQSCVPVSCANPRQTLFRKRTFRSHPSTLHTALPLQTLVSPTCHLPCPRPLTSPCPLHHPFIPSEGFPPPAHRENTIVHDSIRQTGKLISTISAISAFFASRHGPVYWNLVQRIVLRCALHTSGL